MFSMTPKQRQYTHNLRILRNDVRETAYERDPYQSLIRQNKSLSQDGIIRPQRTSHTRGKETMSSCYISLTIAKTTVR